MTTILGLDIGGANLKAATADKRAASVPFALWKHPEQLPAALAELVARFPDAGELAVTMTGELCDCFRTKREGVRHIVQAVEEAWAGREIAYWSTEGMFVPAAEAREHPIRVAAANWHAQATFVARFAPTGFAMMIDTGSTTTDLIPIIDGIPSTFGKTDASRLRNLELLYLGVRRTPVCAVVPGGCAEFFATVQDIHVLRGNMPEEPENLDTADGRPMTKEFSWERIARMIGGDRETVTAEDVGQFLKRANSAMESAFIESFLWLEDSFPLKITNLVISGSGEWFPANFLRDWRPKIPQIRLSQKLSPAISEAACAYSVAVLRSERPR